MAKKLTGAENAASLTKALDAVLAIRDDAAQAEVLVAVAGKLTGEERAEALRKALEATSAVWNIKLRANLQVAVARQLSGDERIGVLEKALNISLYYEEERAEFLAVAEPTEQHAECSVGQQDLGDCPHHRSI